MRRNAVHETGSGQSFQKDFCRTQFEPTFRKRMSNKTNSCAEEFNAPHVIRYFSEMGSQHLAEGKGEAQLFHAAWPSSHPAPQWPQPACLCWRMVPLPHTQGFPHCCGCAVLTGYQPSCAGVTFTALHCGNCSTFYKYLKVHCMRVLQLGLPPSDARSRSICFELDSFVCLHWLLQIMIFSFPLLLTGWAIVSLNALCCNFTFEICTF